MVVVIIINETILFVFGVSGLPALIEAFLVGILYGFISKFEFGWDAF
jgi:hypothetical protein